jgi:NAD(P)-dependent dehydrogenase (short-subunit alcohol dehydrogenase family)
MKMSARGGDTDDSCSEKLVLVTGGSRGIGKATCLLLASKGYQVALNYKTNQEAAQAVVDEIQAPKGKAIAFQADVSKEEEVERLFDQVTEAFGMTPTGLVNNAGVMEPMEKDICNISKETLDKDLATNTYGPFFCTREFVKRASTKRGGKGGSIVNVSSISADGGQVVAYAMSKAAMEAMVAGIAKTLPLEGIRINSVVPGLVDTGMATPEQVEILSGYIPMRRAGEPREIAQAIEYLLSDASSYCTGAKLRISGGL